MIAKRLTSGVSLLLHILAVICICSKAAAKSAFEEHGVVPEVIDHVPADVIEVEYPSGTKIEQGKAISPHQVKVPPTTVTWKADFSKFYTLMMIDPDAISRDNPVLAQIKHWLVVNIPGSDWKQGELISRYAGAAPPVGSGLHRYIFLVYQQPGKVTFDEIKDTEAVDPISRINFSSKDFAAQYGLGEPVAGNFFQSEFDGFLDPFSL